MYWHLPEFMWRNFEQKQKNINIYIYTEYTHVSLSWQIYNIYFGLAQQPSQERGVDQGPDTQADLWFRVNGPRRRMSRRSLQIFQKEMRAVPCPSQPITRRNQQLGPIYKFGFVF
jgi:hypothetical protein